MVDATFPLEETPEERPTKMFVGTTKLPPSKNSVYYHNMMAEQERAKVEAIQLEPSVRQRHQQVEINVPSQQAIAAVEEKKMSDDDSDNFWLD